MQPSALPAALERHFGAAWSELGLVEPAGLLAELLNRYREPHRAYHNVRHLEECLAAFAPARGLAEHPAEVELALYFHDIVYVVRRSDNEEQSALWAHADLLAVGAPRAVAERVRDLILATRHEAIPEGTDARLLVDADLAILGAAAERFDEYEEQVRQEYSWVPGFLYRSRRADILRRFLARPRLYATDFFADRLERPARDNLGRSLVRLR